MESARPSDGELAEALRRSDFADWSGATMLLSLVLVAACAIALQLGAPTNVLVPAIGVVIATALVATATWAITELRANRFLDRLDSEPRPAAPPWKYALSFGVAAAAGVAYWFASDQVRHWLWMAYALAGMVVWFAMPMRRRRRSVRRRR